MTEKANTPVDELNKVLTNTLDYKSVLLDLSKSISHDATKNKLNEFAEIKEKESRNLMKLIKALGGRIETNERMTDQESIYWVRRPLPEAKDMDAVLDKLIRTERNAIDDYESLLTRKELTSEHRDVLKKHKQEAEANLDYFQGAREALDKKST